MEVVTCTKCGETKLASEFYPEKRKSNGLSSQCRACIKRSWNKAARNRTPQERAAIRRKYGDVALEVPYVPKALIMAQAAVKRADKAASKCALNDAVLAWNEWLTERAPAWWLSSWHASETARKERETGRRREKWRRKYRARYNRNAEIERERVVAYKNANPDKVEAWQGKRADRMIATSDGSLTAPVIRKLLDEATTCPYDGLPLDGRVKALDHIEPLKLDGTHTINNVVVCCQKCNNRKSARPFAEWVSMLDMVSAERASALYRLRFGRDPLPRPINANLASTIHAEAA